MGWGLLSVVERLSASGKTDSLGGTTVVYIDQSWDSLLRLFANSNTAEWTLAVFFQNNNIRDSGN